MFGRKRSSESNVESEPLTCTICGKDVDGAEDYTIYDIMRGYRYTRDDVILGTIVAHHNAGCTIEAVKALDEQSGAASQYVVRVETRISQTTYMYYCYVLGFEFAANSSYTQKQRQPTLAFLNAFRREKNTVFVRMNISTETYDIPTLLSRDNPLIPKGFLDGKEYQRQLKDAKARLERGIIIRGRGGEQGAITLARYVKDTVISLEETASYVDIIEVSDESLR